MNRFCAIAVLLFGIISVEAAQINEHAARQKAESFVANKATTRGMSTLSRVFVPFQNVGAMDSVQNAPLYIFNIEGGGYVIVSGDDRAEDILGFSENGHLDPDRMPSNMRNWLDGYARSICHLPANTMPQQRQTRAAISKKDISPRLNTAWGQDWPYNLHAPELHVVWRGEERIVNAATGCVATAMAQILNYYRYPDKTLQKLKSFTGTADVPVTSSKEAEDTVQVDWVTNDIPAGAVIDWANITDKYDKNSTKNQIEAISRLMQYCGSSVTMSYGIESSARTDSLVYGLYDIFGYKDVYMLHRFNYDAQEWVDVLYDVLSKEGPLLFGGDCPDDKGGHQFILDGYKHVDGADYFYANWGWDGDDDGYMLLDVMSPGWIFNDDGDEVGFTEGQLAISGVGPNGKGKTSIDKLLYCEWLELGTEGKVYKRSNQLEGFDVEYAIYFSNYDHPYVSYQAGIGIFQNGELVDGFTFTNQKGIDIPLWYYWGYESESEDDRMSFGDGLGDGVYQIKLLSCESGDDDWQVCRFGDEKAVVMTIDGNKATFGPYTPSTGVKSVFDAPSDAKSAVWHSLSGQRISGTPSLKGIYVQNGRKVVVK